MDLVRALSADAGVTCLVGAGGKKSTMYALGGRLDRAVLTATVRIPIFDEHVASVAVTADPASAIAEATAWPLGVVPAREGEDRYRGYDPAVVDDLADGAAPVLVKADGARMRRFKAPGAREPRIPGSATTVVPVVSAHVVGEPLDDRRVHRVDRVATVAGIEPGDPISPEAIARVIASPAGGRKDVPSGATLVPLVNMIDDEDDRRAGREIASAVHRRTEVPHVVLARMLDADPVVEVVPAPSRF